MAELRKTLGVWRGTGMMLNIVLGAGLFTLPGLAAEAAGGAAILVWLACALTAAPLLCVFALLGRNVPSSGGLAAIIGWAFGDVGYVIATLLFLGAVAFGLPAIAITGGHYLAEMAGGVPHLYAAGLIGLAMLANLASPEIAGRINAVLASLMVMLLIAMGAVGWWLVEPSVAATFEAAVADTPSLAVLTATFMMVFFAFTGWEVSANLNGEFREPRRDVPRAMALSFLIAVLLYAALALVVQAANLSEGYAAPFAAIFGGALGPAGMVGVSVLTVLIVFANLSAALWAVSRMVYSAANERLLPAALGMVWRGTPQGAVGATVLVLLTVVLAAWVGQVDLGIILAVAGENFLLLYAGAAVALVWTSQTGWHRALGWGCLAIVTSIILARGIAPLLYPLALGALGVISGTRRRRGSPPLHETGH